VRGLEAAAEFSYGAYRTYQVTIARIEELTGLSFGSLSQLDPLEGLEVTGRLTEVRSERDIAL